LKHRLTVLTAWVLAAGLAGCGRAPEAHQAAERGDPGALEKLLAADATLVNVKDKDGRTPLHVAAQAGHKPVVELLVARGADLNARDEDSRTPLHLAAAEGHKDVVEFLLDKGADVDVKDKAAWTPVHWAAYRTHKEVVALLIARGPEEQREATYESVWSALILVFFLQYCAGVLGAVLMGVVVGVFTGRNSVERVILAKRAVKTCLISMTLIFGFCAFFGAPTKTLTGVLLGLVLGAVVCRIEAKARIKRFGHIGPDRGVWTGDK